MSAIALFAIWTVTAVLCGVLIYVSVHEIRRLNPKARMHTEKELPGAAGQ